MTDWQPIETAPRDGTPILIWQPNAGFAGDPQEQYMPDGALAPGEHSYTRADPRLKRYDDRRFAIGYWRPWAVEGKTKHPWGNRNSADPEPTHWMPLPTPPA